MRDGSAVHDIAMTTLKVLYLNVLDVGCFSHTTDNSGGHFYTPVLDEFIHNWLALFAHRPKT